MPKPAPLSRLTSLARAELAEYSVAALKSYRETQARPAGVGNLG